jgi:hypothetical protein
MNDFRHTVEDAVSLDNPHLREAEPPSSVAGVAFDVEKLEYYQTLHARHTLYARAALLLVVFGMLGANMWLTQSNFETLMVNLDASRTDQQVVMDQHTASIDAQNHRLAAIEGRLVAIEAQTPPTAEVASAAEY